MNEEVKVLLELMKFHGNDAEQKNDIDCVKFATEKLKSIGCEADLQIFNDTANVLATIGSGKKSICFCGHCDVVPTGMQKWSKNPCGEVVKEEIGTNTSTFVDKVYGRGAVDMLGGDACWIVALQEITKERPDVLKKIKINTLLTGAEEGDGTNGTAKMVEYLKTKNVCFDACIVGEPTSEFGEHEEIDDKKLSKVCCGRQGSFTFFLTIHGKSGHIAYKNMHDNPIKKAVKLCAELYKIKWNKHTNLEIIKFDADNQTDNVVLDKIELIGNVRFYDVLAKDVERKFLKCLKKMLNSCDYELKIDCSRFGYLTKQNDGFLQLVLREMKKYNKNAYADMCFACTDGEYMAQISKSVCELGLITKMMHQPDEYTTIQNLADLKQLYKNVIIAFAEG